MSTGIQTKSVVTRPANVTAYTAGDVVGGAFAINGLAPQSNMGGEFLIRSTELEIDIAAVPAGMAAFNLYLYSVTPPSAIADNGPWTFGAGDRPSFVGKIPLGTAVLEGTGTGTVYVRTDKIDAQISIPDKGQIFGYLVTVGGFTPAGNSEVYNLTLHGIRQ